MASAVDYAVVTPSTGLGGGLGHFYREHRGYDTLSRNYQSSELFTPFQVPQRPTVSDSRYQHYRELLEKTPRVPWGMHREYAGEDPINLPNEHRPRSEPPPAVEKGHRHFGSGTDPYPRGLPIEQYYNLTSLKKSNVRSNDQLLPRPEKCDMTAIQIDRMFPAEHPYSSHMSRYAVFPSFKDTPDDYKTGEAQRQLLPKHQDIPSNPDPVTIGSKSKGGAHRWEIQQLPPDSLKKALSWPGDVFFQQRKTPQSGQQQFYPVPPKAVLPNHAPRQLDYTINPKTANALRNVERSQWITTYKKQYTGYGPANALALDNYDEKVEAERRKGIEDHSLRPRSYNTFMPARPYEGRISRMIGPNQLLRCVVKDGRIKYVPFTPKIEIEMDKVKEHVNLPSETHDSFQDPAKMAQWKKLQSLEHPDTHLQKLQQRQGEGVWNPTTLSKNKEKTKDPMKELVEKRKDELNELTENTRWRQAELQKHHDDLRLLKRKVDYTTPQLRPPVYYDTLHKIYSTKPPFYYDGDNPYEYDYVGPWDYHKTNAIIEQYAKEGKLDDTLSQVDPAIVHPFDWDKYQFAGSPGNKSSIMNKYTGNQLLNGITRLEQSVAHKPVAQSNYVHSYNPDRVKSALTANDGKVDLSDLKTSLPAVYTSRRPVAPSTGKSVQINETVRVATGGGEVPLDVKEYESVYPQGLIDGRTTAINARDINQQGTKDRQFDWTADYPQLRDQTKLLDIQNSFTKTDAMEKFHNTFSESALDLRENINTGKAHSFGGENAYYWH